MPPTPHILTVTAAESGIKLLGFLARRLGKSAAPAEMHRWIRTGQVRVNGGRARPYDRVFEGDAVRLPPFAAGAARQVEGDAPVAPGETLEHGVRVLAVTADFLVLEKPAWLSSQPGSGQTTSVSDILRSRFAACAYIPSPAHRLDKMTSGLLLAGRTHAAQERLHALFARKAEHPREETDKEYLAWVSGAWPHDGERTLRDYLAKEKTRTPAGAVFETVRGVEKNRGKKAESRVALLTARVYDGFSVSLLRIRLETGRTHQIRAQLALRGFPVMGDGKYGGKAFSPMLLHAFRLSFPWRDTRMVFISRPEWPAPFALAQEDLFPGS